MNKLNLIDLINKTKKLLDKYENNGMDDEQKKIIISQLQKFQVELIEIQDKRQEYLIRSEKNLEHIAGVEQSLKKEINELLLRLVLIVPAK